MMKFLLLFLFGLPLFAQDAAGADPLPPEVPGNAVRNDLVSLSGLLESLQARELQQDQLHARLQAAGDDIQRAAIRRELEATIAEVEDLRREFRRVALSTDISVFDTQQEEPFDWQQELVKFARPMLAVLENLTAESRELAELNEDLEIQTRRRDTARRALENLDRLLLGEMEESLRQRLSSTREMWQGRLRDAENRITSVQNTLDQRMAEREDPVGRARGAATNFIRTTGRNLTFGILAFVAVYMGMNLAYKLVRKFRPAPKKGRSFSTRLFTLIWTLLGVVFGLGAMLAVFNLTGDLFLLSVTIVFLVGAGWAATKTLPQFIELFRMMLNMGAVKEDERLFFDGIPWQVESIGFKTHLINPLLDGGDITLPTRMFVGLHSRPQGKKEEWFPSRDKDWVLLEDGTYGRVTYQTPTGVQLTLPGGSQKVIPTEDYIKLAPRVLSTGFRHEIDFGIDYRHQADAVSMIPQAMQAHLQTVLEEQLGKALQHVQVDLREAADSALTYGIIVDCGPDAGQHWFMIPRRVQTALVDLCNQNGWTIPFPQLHIHQ